MFKFLSIQFAAVSTLAIVFAGCPVPAHAFFNLNFIRKKATAGPVDCVNGSPNIGDTCAGGGIYIGTYTYSGNAGAKKIMITPGGCSFSQTPTCPGTADSVTLAWGTFNVTTGATDLEDGDADTTAVVGADGAAAAAKYCADMVYAGFTDWYLPAQNELALIYNNRGVIPGLSLTNTGYWASTEASAFSGWSQRFDTGAQVGNAKTQTEYVRCMRRF